MKRKLLPLLALLVSCSFALGSDAPQLATEGQRAYLSGDTETAKAKFKMALELDSSNVTARNYLRMILVQEAKAGGGGELEKQLRTLRLPSVKFTDATFGAALEALKQQAAQQSIKVSFVSQLSAEEMQKPVTLNLENVPFTEALRYACDLAGAKFAVEKFAVVIKKPTAADPAASPAS